MRITSLAFALALFASTVANAAGIADWSTEIASSSPGYTTTNVTEPMQADIGTFDIATNGGVSYEFIYNADVGGASSAFMGSLSAPVGDSAGLKLDQWNNTGKFGATAFGVADYTFATDNVLNADTQVVYVMNGTSTDLYVNGALAEGGIADVSFALSGLTGIGHAYNHGNDGSVDALNGTLLGVAVYDSALSGDAVAAHWQAYVPEPASMGLLSLGFIGLLQLRRARR